MRFRQLRVAERSRFGGVEFVRGGVIPGSLVTDGSLRPRLGEVSRAVVGVEPGSEE